MVIKSPFKDYYDYVANQYGGGDPKIVYPRTRLGYQTSFFVEVVRTPLTSLKRTLLWLRTDRRWAYLIIAGKAYLISQPATAYSDNLNSFRLEPLVDPVDDARPYWQRQRPKNIEYGKEYPELIDLCRKVGHPVFVVLDVWHGGKSEPIRMEISHQCPILQNLGIPSLIPATQMYQDLSYFVGNLMKNSPDVKPPVELSNTQKIIKAGFDLVKSFRHRT